MSATRGSTANIMEINEEKPDSHVIENAENHPRINYQSIDEFADDKGIAAEAIGGVSADDLPPGYYKSFSFLGTWGGCIFGVYALFLSGSMPINVVTNINDDIGPDPNYSWIAIIFSVTSAFSFVLLGRLGDLLGRRWVFLGSTVIGVIGCIIAAAAPTIPAVIVGMALIGIHSAAQQSYTMILAELAPNKYRGYVSAIIFCVAAPVVGFGPVFIRLMIQNISHGWRWAFGIAAICNGLSLLLLSFCYHPPTFKMLHANREKVSAWKMVDFIGVILFVTGMVLFLLSLSWGGSVYPWRSGRVVGFLVTGVILLVAFGFWEAYGAKNYPLIPVRLWKNRAFMGITFSAGIATMTYYALLVLWPIQLTVLYDDTLLGVGFKSCVIQCGTLLGYALSALLMKPLGKQKWQFIGGVIVLTAIMGGMAGTTENTQAMALVFLAIVGASIGWIECLSLTLSPFCLKHEDLGIALGTVGSVRGGLAAIAQTIFVVIYTDKSITEVPAYVTRAAVDAGLPASSIPALLGDISASSSFAGIPGITPNIIAAATEGEKAGYSRSFQYVYLASIAFGCLGILSSLFAPNSEEKFNSAISRRLHAKGITKNTAASDESTDRPRS